MSEHLKVVPSLKSVESVSSACVISLEFVEMRYFLFVPLCDCNNNAPMSDFQASQIA